MSHAAQCGERRRRAPLLARERGLAGARGGQGKLSARSSQRECSGGGPAGPVVLNAGGNAVRLDIGPITWVDDATAKITGGGPHAGGMTTSEREYTVVLDGGEWKITAEKPGMTI